MIKLMMHGCNGKMGQVISDLVREDKQVEIVAGIDGFMQKENTYPVFSTIGECNIEVDAIIDFSAVGAIDDLLAYCKNKKIPCVLCTTGLSKEQLVLVEEAAKEVAILKSANMSLGINLLLKMLKEATSVLVPADFDIEIVEKHHNKKVDAPSGTALALADSIQEELNNEYKYVYDRSPVRVPREKKEIGLSAVRGGTIVGEHDVIFAGADEVITFSHTAYSKVVFAKGAIEAAKFIAGKSAGLYNMEDVIQGSM